MNLLETGEGLVELAQKTAGQETSADGAATNGVDAHAHQLAGEISDAEQVLINGRQHLQVVAERELFLHLVVSQQTTRLDVVQQAGRLDEFLETYAINQNGQ